LDSAASSPFAGLGFTTRRASSQASISASLCTLASNSVFTVSWLGGMGTILPSTRPFTLTNQEE
jgi:hypothetical protein